MEDTRVIGFNDEHHEDVLLRSQREQMLSLIAATAVTAETDLKNDSETEYHPALDGKAVLAVGAHIDSLWHYSPSRISQFSKERAEDASGKYGKGTYFGIGDLGGETVDILKSGNNIRHDAEFTGNLLAVDLENVVDVIQRLKKLKGLPTSRLKSNVANGTLTDLVEGLTLEGGQVDAVLVYRDTTRTTAELVVLPSAIDKVELLSAA